MIDWPLLSLVIFLPQAGAGFILLIRGEPHVVAQNARAVALWTSSITFALSLLIWANFEPGSADFQLVEKAEWFAGFGINYHLGVDGISLWFVILSTLLTVLCVIRQLPLVESSPTPTLFVTCDWNKVAAIPERTPPTVGFKASVAFCVSSVCVNVTRPRPAMPAPDEPLPTALFLEKTDS